VSNPIDLAKIVRSPRETWHILTGEYPPDHGGVSDYTRAVAMGMVQAGVDVHVWTRGSTSDETLEGVVVHRCLGAFERTKLDVLERELKATKKSSMLLVQYVPHGFGMRAMNIPLARWIGQQSKSGIDVRLMLHELAFPFVRWPLHHNLIAFANRWMLRSILSNPNRIYLSTTAWQSLVRRYSRRGQNAVCLPIPSNIPGTPQPEAATIRESFTASDPQAVVIGHFGTFGGEIRRLVIETMHRLLARSTNVKVALIGRGATSASTDLLLNLPADLSGHVHSLENASEDKIAAWIQACDIMLQPFPDGISTRRTSAMAGFANGVAVVSNLGSLAEPFWRKEDVVWLADAPKSEQLADKAFELVTNRELRSRLAKAGRLLHDREFTMENTVRVLLNVDVTRG
jgi:glycosyltransferase involved in cell wall biosynthesis